MSVSAIGPAGIAAAAPGSGSLSASTPTYGAGRALAILPAPLTPVTYYVSPSGSDSSAGTSPAAPWASVARVNAVTLGPGDTVLFSGGHTWTGTTLAPSSSSPAPAAPVTIGSYGTGTATISSGLGAAISVANAGSYVIENLNVAGIAGSTSFAGIQFRASGTGRLPGIQILNCTVSGWRYGISIGADLPADGYDAITISGCAVSGCLYGGIFVWGTEFSPASPSYNHYSLAITGCVAHDNPGTASVTDRSTGSGILVSSVTGGTISGCTAYGNGAGNGCATAGPVGIWCYAANNVTITGCTSYANSSGTAADGCGLDIDVDCTNCVIEYCLAYGNAGAGILLWGGADGFWATNTCRYNITAGNVTHGGTFYGELTVGSNGAGAISGPLIHSNTLISATTGTAVITFPAPNAIAGCQLLNNILYASSTDQVIRAASDHDPASIWFLGNCYFSASAFMMTWNGTSYSAIADWRAATGQETLNAASHGLQADPLLAGGTGASGCKLRPGSPCAGTGINLTTLGISPGTRDYFGNPNPPPLSIGACQGQ